MPASPHDALFKQAFTDLDNARGELRAALPPDIRARIDWATLRVEKGSFVDAALRSRHTDLLFSVQLDGREARIYVLFEHQSDVDLVMPFRMLAYVVRIWEAWRREHPGSTSLPPVLPVLLAQVPNGWTGPVDLFDLLEFGDGADRDAFTPHMPRLRVIVDDLALLTDDTLAGREMPEAARLALAALKHARDAATLLALLTRLAGWIRQLPDTDVAREMLATVLRYIAAIRRVGMEEIQAAVATAAPDVEDRVMTTLEQLEQRGEARGIALGRQAAAEILLNFLTLRFGPVSDDARARIALADVATLQRWSKLAMTASSLDAVLAG
jgi:predicted transposase YdaD